MVFVGLFLVFLGVMIVHELGHAVAMAYYGIPIQAAGVGIPIPGLSLKFHLYTPSPEYRHKLFPEGLVITLSPLLLGAYVQPAAEGEERVKTLPYRAEAEIYGAGVWSNTLSALILFIFLRLYAFGFNQDRYGFLLCGVVMVLAVGLWKYKTVFCAFGVPVLSILLIALLSFLVLQSGASKTFSGPVGIVRLMQESTTALDVLKWGFILSLGIGLTNMLPFLPLDGGHTAMAIVRRHCPRHQHRIERVSMMIGIGFILFVLLNDVL